MDPVRASYDTIAGRYAQEIGGELAGKPVDRALYALFAELVGAGTVGDVGCGPGHVTAHLAGLGVRTVGVDLSPGMVAVARARYPELDFTVGSCTDLPVPDRAWAGAVLAYSVIHLSGADRARTWRELARVVQPGGWLLVAFHVQTADRPVGSTYHLGEWWGQPVDLDFHYLDTAQLTAELADAGSDVIARTDREPWPEVEYPSRRCYLLARLRTVVQ